MRESWLAMVNPVRNKRIRIVSKIQFSKGLPYFCLYIGIYTQQVVPKEGTMSTASRDCGTPSGACARWENAPPGPGCSGKTRGYYDLRASLQLGLPQGLRALRKQEGTPRIRGFLKPPRPKCEPETKIAAPASWAFAPFSEYSGLRGARLRHSPPFFLRSTHPPPRTITIVEEIARDGLSPRRTA